jgi:hypothetical protein
MSSSLNKTKLFRKFTEQMNEIIEEEVRKRVEEFKIKFNKANICPSCKQIKADEVTRLRHMQESEERKKYKKIAINMMHFISDTKEQEFPKFDEVMNILNSK